MGPCRELFVDAEDAIERERIAAATRRWDAVLRDLYPPTDSKALQLVRELDIEARIVAYCRGNESPLLHLPTYLSLGLSNLL